MCAHTYIVYTAVTMSNFIKLEKQLKAVGNQRRLRILSFLKRNRSATVEEICKTVGIKSQSASQHLRILRNADIVTYSKRGLFVTYRLYLPQKQPIKQVISLL